MDKHEFAQLLTDMGLRLNSKELDYTWRVVDINGSGEIDFEEFVAWFKNNTGDRVSTEMRRVLRLTSLLTAAKGALVYAVDPGDRAGKRALRDLFDILDDDGSTIIGPDEITRMIEDLHIDATYTDVLQALDEIDQDGNREIDFDEFIKWWCSTSRGTSGMLRGKLKLAAFTSKRVGSVLTTVATDDDSTEQAEKFMNELLSAAFSAASDMTGRSLGIFGVHNSVRIWCYDFLGKPYTDRVLLALIFANVGLVAIQTPGAAATVYLSLANLAVMGIFTTEMCFRVIANGFYVGEAAYLKNGWNVFDFVIIGAVWTAYAASLFLDLPRELSSSLVLLRSVRALRFFVHIRNILSSIVAGRTMLTAVVLILLFLLLLVYVVAYQMLSGAVSVHCAPPSTNCSLCVEQLSTCPESIVCATEDERCFRVSERITTGLRPEHTDKYGFDTFGQTLTTLSAVVTLDDWRELGNEFRGSDATARTAAWPIFATAVIVLGLFSVNMFAAALAYSYIKVRKHARNMEAANSTKKNLVQRLLVEKSATQLKEAQAERHFLQRLSPAATRTARHIVNTHLFGTVITWVVGLNIMCMAAVSHDMSPDRELFFEILEGIFTVVYTCECYFKLQAMGFKQYFDVILNRLDFIIVSASLSSYVLRMFGSDSRAEKSSVLRLLRLLKLFRAARIAKLIFRNEKVKEMASRAFAGIEALLSLVVFILFTLTLAAVAGMNLLHDCSDTSTTSHSPSFNNAFQALVVVFQVFTADGWSQVMYNTVECAGAPAAVFFSSIVCVCYFVLGNLFVAIFMENLEINDDEKRDKQVLAYLEAVATLHEESPQSALGNLHNAMDSVSDMLSETARLNRSYARKGPEAFMAGARLISTGVVKTGSVINKLATKKNVATDELQPYSASRLGDVAASVRATGAKFLGRVKGDELGAGSEYEVKAAKLTTTEKIKLVLESTVFSYVQVAMVALAMIHSALDPSLVKEVVAVSSATLVNDDLSDGISHTAAYYYLLLLDSVLFIAFTVEISIKTYAYSLCGGPESVLQTSHLTFELCLVILQYLVLVGVPYTRGLLAFRSLRILIIIERFRVMAKAFIASLTAVWTIFVLMAATFVAFGIITMGLYSGRLWYCRGAEHLDEDPCRAMHDVDPNIEWQNRDYHFDNIFEAMLSLFVVWSLQGWTTLWYWTMDSTADTWAAPSKDNDIVGSFIVFATFIIWNSFMLTKLFTGMLCDFFSQSSGSVLMTAEQRNWQFMSMFLAESLKHEISRPTAELPLKAFDFVHNFYVQGVIDLTIILSVLSMVGQQSVLENDPTGSIRVILLVVDEYILVIYTLEAAAKTVAFGPRNFLREYKSEVIVLATLWATVVHSILRDQLGIQWLHWVQSLTFIRGLRLVTVFTGIQSIRKIYFVLRIALPQVLNLIGIMSIIFFMLGCSVQHLCSGAPRGATLTDMDNFDTVVSSIMLLFQVTTGQSLMGVTTECRAVAGPVSVIFFVAYFIATNMLLVNLFIAVLLDNFDLMGSEDMAVSDMDIEMFKQTWLDCGLNLHGGVNIAELKSFVSQDGMGTFSMMQKADPYYFNRVLFELRLTHSQVRRARKEIEFFPLILALCHIRFSSSCLSLADEADKSRRLVRQHEDHAAKLLQVQSRAWLAWRHPPKWVECKTKPGKNGKEAEIVENLDVLEDTPEGEEARKKDTRSKTKKQWDFTVQLASVWVMTHVINTDRITPEHVVAETFKRLQELVQKGTDNQKLMKTDSEDGSGASLLSKMAMRSTDGMTRSKDEPKKKLSRQRTTDFSGDSKQNGQTETIPADDTEESASRFGRKKKENTAVTAQNPLLRSESDDAGNRSGGTKVSNPLMAAIVDSDEDNDTKPGKTSQRKAKVVDKRLIYVPQGKHKHWLAETYEDSSSDEEETGKVIKESAKAQKARKKLEAIKAQQQQLEDRQNGVQVAKKPGRFKSRFTKPSGDENPDGGSDDSDDEQTAPKSKLPHWLAELEPEAEAEAEADDTQGTKSRRDKKKNSASIKVGNPLFEVDYPEREREQHANVVANPLLDSALSMTDSDDGANKQGLGGKMLFQYRAPSFDGDNPGGRATAQDIQDTLDFKKKKAFMSRKTTIK